LHHKASNPEAPPGYATPARPNPLNVRKTGLVVYGLGDASRLHLTGQTLGQVLAGPRRWRADQRYLSTRELRVATDPPLPLDLDGEVCGTTPVGITLLPQALRVLVPSTFVDT
jgi:diacylglycerol kinase family enzyme